MISAKELVIGLGLVVLGYFIGRHFGASEGNLEPRVEYPELQDRVEITQRSSDRATEEYHVDAPVEERDSRAVLSQAPSDSAELVTSSRSVVSAFEGLEASLRDNPQFEGDEVGLQAKYGSLSVDALLTIKFLLTRRQRSEAERISKQRIEAGLFETAILPPGEKLALQSSKGGMPRTIGFGADPSGDPGIIRTTAIEPEEYPEYHALLREATWIHRRLHRERACECFE